MKILSVHNYYNIPGGEDKSCKNERELLRKNGCTVIEFNLHNKSIKGILGWTINLFNVFFNYKVYRDIKRLIELENIDLVHVQNFFPLISPSVFYAAKHKGIPSVFTVRNYRLLCVNGLFYQEKINQICEKCNKKTFKYPSIIHRCYRGSRIQSLVVTLMLFLHQVIGTWKKINGVILLTDFAKDKFLQNNFDPKKVFVKANFFAADDCITPVTLKKKQICFIGRLSEEKGIVDLLNAWSHVEKDKYSLVIAGSGPLLDLVMTAQENDSSISYLGHLDYRGIYSLLSESLVCVFSSNWYEGMPRTIIEAYACSTPVIAKDIGAMSTMVTEGETGFKYATSTELASKIQHCLDNVQQITAMGLNCTAEYRKKYQEHANFIQLNSIYKQLIDEAKRD